MGDPRCSSGFLMCKTDIIWDFLQEIHDRSERLLYDKEIM